MASCSTTKRNTTPIELELYFLIERFLSSGPCKSAAQVLRRELTEHGLIPRRIDWEGKEHQRSFESLLELNRHIGGYHLLKICERLGPLLDDKIKSSIVGVKSLLGAGSQSLLRTEEDMRKLEWPPQAHAALLHGRASLPPINLVQPNRMYVRRGQEMSGQTHFNHVVPRCMYDQMQLHSRKLGHLSAVYCVLFDRTGRYIFTGADDQLVKIWIAEDGRLKATLRGHSAEITDMAVNFENTLLASGSCDKTIRVWCLKTKAAVAVLQGHTGMITSLQFSPLAKTTTRYLASTGGDACVCFWEWDVRSHKFSAKPVKYIERSRAGAQLLCSSFSPGGMFFAAGSTDHVIRLYHFHAGFPEKIGELEKHVDRVDSICYCHRDNRFLSGSRDGVARIWRFERSEWRSIALHMNETLQKKRSDEEEDRRTEIQQGEGEGNQAKLKVNMVGWTIDDTLVITAINDFSLKVWCSFTGRLQHVLKAHEDEVFVLEPSPLDSRIMLSAGHDGNIFIWDIIRGEKVKGFFNLIEGQGHGAVFDCKFSPDGTTFCGTDSHGHLMIHGFGSNEKFKKTPDALFFHTDYRPLIRDANNYVLDEQTQQAPHLMPPPFLVDIDGNPYPAQVQRLVPGRENCREDQLVPQLAVNEEGEQEVMGDRELEEPPEPEVVSGEVQPAVRPSIDEMIEELQRQQDQRMAASGEVPIGSPPAQLGSPRAGGVSRSNSMVGPGAAGPSHMVGMRRVGETEGVRQSLGNIQQVSTSKDLAAMSRRVVVKDLDPAILRRSETERIVMGEMEVRQYNVERKKKNMVVRRDSGDEPLMVGIKTRKKKTTKSSHGGADSEDTATNRLTQRALYDTDEELEEELGPEMWEEEEELGVECDSSDDSDWGANTGSNLQPPKRTSKRVRKRKHYSTTEETDEQEVRGSRENSQSRLGSRENSQSRSSRASSRKKEVKSEKQPMKRKRTVKRKTTSGSAENLLPGRTPEEVSEILSKWRPPDWLTEVIPRKQPYFPQMGDELMYFRQGHELYVKAVERRGTYPIDPNKNQPWHKNTNLREQELVRIVYVKYELLKNGVRLCHLKLSFLDPATLKCTGGSFRIKYHDMPDVVDFLVLKQNYDIAMARNWKPGDRFRSMIDDSWWMGIIETQIPFQEEYSDSMFQCFKVRWDNAERECLSPWDLEPVDDSRPPPVIGGGLVVTPGELKALMYKPKPSEWPGEDLDRESDRYVHGLEQAMEHSIAEPFLTPVDLNKFPSYAMSIEYPMDLNTIKRRIENRFYRRVTALQFDLRYIESNARKFNEPRSQIVKSAQILTDALLSYISDEECTDVCQIINKLSKGRKFQWSSDSDDSGEETEEYDTPGTSKKKKDEAGTSNTDKKRRVSVGSLDPDSWKEDCRQLLNTIIQCEDSKPFREPVNIEEYPNYYEVIEQPMDLGNIRASLETGRYSEPLQMASDLRLMFTNSKCYNTNKRSRIYSMTLRLSAMFESKMKEIIAMWKRALKHQKKCFPNYLLPKSERVYPVSKSTSSPISSRPFASVSRARHSSLTNGRAHDSDDTDVDVTTVSRSSRQPPCKRPRRERRAVQRRHAYIDSDIEDHRFPEPKPDYTDDDFEMEKPKKSSPKKKKVKSQSRKLSKKPSSNGVSNGTSSSTRYSTRASTGVIKTRKYTNEGFFTEEEEEDTEVEEDVTVVIKKESRPVISDSDTEVESPSPRQSKRTKNARQSKSSKSNSKSSKRNHRKVVSSRGVTDSEEESSSSDSDTESSSKSESESNSSGWETEPDSPMTRSKHTQGSQARQQASSEEETDSDSGKVRGGKPQNSSYASSSSKSRIGGKPSRQTRNRGKPRVTYNEDSDNSDSTENSVTVSMRGRVRRPTARARAFLL